MYFDKKRRDHGSGRQEESDVVLISPLHTLFHFQFIKPKRELLPGLHFRKETVWETRLGPLILSQKKWGQ